MDSNPKPAPMCSHAAAARIAALEAEVERLKADADRQREAEAACCPEDFSFTEVIAKLRADVARLERERDEANGAAEDRLHRLIEAERENEELDAALATAREALEKISHEFDCCADWCSKRSKCQACRMAQLADETLAKLGG